MKGKYTVQWKHLIKGPDLQWGEGGSWRLPQEVTFEQWDGEAAGSRANHVEGTAYTDWDVEDNMLV